MRLENKVAIVTGSAKGIGRAISLKFAEEGAHLVINDQSNPESKKSTHEVAEEVKALNRRALTVAADISNNDEVKDLFAQTLDVYGRVDILVNNAGIVHYVGLKDLTEDLWQRLMDVNLKGPFLCSKIAGEIMVKQGSGKIINIASLFGVKASSQCIHYHVSKAGVIMLTKCMALALSPQVQVNCISPGSVMAGGTLIRGEEYRKSVLEKTPLRRLGQPLDIANACVFLASSEADHITGQMITVDGGYSLI
ncbi:MAG: glucose 1-dehydrogenase [Nitrososphaeria archaeon]|nr:glucose 1-dehydrogenase [Nitrososphaeria archaeon]NIN52212.1 glucose 1-dehydrogenase [Nitrososphaeria archaeon]NIQ32665.1 glucose 1-dehydrogenase [Nitrososphaeria archaeon]